MLREQRAALKENIYSLPVRTKDDKDLPPQITQLLWAIITKFRPLLTQQDKADAVANFGKGLAYNTFTTYFDAIKKFESAMDKTFLECLPLTALNLERWVMKMAK